MKVSLLFHTLDLLVQFDAWKIGPRIVSQRDLMVICHIVQTKKKYTSVKIIVTLAPEKTGVWNRLPFFWGR